LNKDNNNNNDDLMKQIGQNEVEEMAKFAMR